MSAMTWQFLAKDGQPFTLNEFHWIRWGNGEQWYAPEYMFRGSHTASAGLFDEDPCPGKKKWVEVLREVPEESVAIAIDTPVQRKIELYPIDGFINGNGTVVIVKRTLGAMTQEEKSLVGFVLKAVADRLK